MGLIVTAESHLDHKGLTGHLVAHILKRYKDEKEFFIETFTIPPDLEPLACSLYGELMGDDPFEPGEVVLGKRGDRQHFSRLVDRPLRTTRMATVVGGPDDHGQMVIYTIYGGPQAPREPGDISIKSETERKLSEEFWSVHALSKDS